MPRMAKATAASASDRDALRRVIDESNMSLRQLAADAGISDGTIRAYLDGKTETLHVATAERIAAALGTTWASITGMPTAQAGRPMPKIAQVPVYAASPATGPKGLPGAFQLQIDRPPIEIRRQVPPSLAVASRAFAFRLPVYDLAPHFRSGELLAADPDRPLAIGDDALVTLRGGVSVIGTVLALDGDGITLTMGADNKPHRLAHAGIDSVAYLLRRGDFLGA